MVLVGESDVVDVVVSRRGRPRLRSGRFGVDSEDGEAGVLCDSRLVTCGDTVVGE